MTLGPACADLVLAHSDLHPAWADLCPAHADLHPAQAKNQPETAPSALFYGYFHVLRGGQ